MASLQDSLYERVKVVSAYPPPTPKYGACVFLKDKNIELIDTVYNIYKYLKYINIQNV